MLKSSFYTPLKSVLWCHIAPREKQMLNLWDLRIVGTYGIVIYLKLLFQTLQDLLIKIILYILGIAASSLHYPC